MGEVKNMPTEPQFGAKLAHALGISPEELELLDYDLDEDRNDNGFLYCYWVTFGEECDGAILAKVQGLSDGRVEISVGTFDDEEWAALQGE